MSRYVLAALSATSLFVSCGDVGEVSAGDGPDDGVSSGEVPGGPPADTYACDIDAAGYCIFTGTPHPSGLEPGTEGITDRDGEVLFGLDEAVAVNAAGEILEAKGTPAFDGDHLVAASTADMDDDERAFHKVMALMFPIRNALMYDIADLTRGRWEALVAELTLREIKATTFTDGATPKDNYYGRDGVFDLARAPGGEDIHHDVMKFLEEAGLTLLCHVTSESFGQMLHDTHPEGHDPCLDAGVTTRVPF